MKKSLLILTAFGLCVTIFAQEISHETIVVNIEVPVRVFDGGKFVENLTIDDFEVYEEGLLQKIEAIYLIKKTSIERKEIKDEVKSKKPYSPTVSRHFVLCFILTEYLPKAAEAVDYFFNNVIQDGDTLTVITPLKTYNLKSEILEKMPRQRIIQQLIGLLRKDIIMGNSEYKDVIEELERAAFAKNTEQYKIALDQLEQLRYIDQNQLIQFADFLKSKEGQKYVFIFYQQEAIPLLELSIADDVDPKRPGSLREASFFFDIIAEGISLNVDLVKQAYCDSLTSIHFFYITKKIRNPIDPSRLGSLQGMRFVEKSGDIFAAFNEMANATGGVTDSTANISYAFQKGVDASENYYLLYYAPKDYKSDGKFRSINVKVKGKNYRVLHRAGYLAD